MRTLRQYINEIGNLSTLQAYIMEGTDGAADEIVLKEVTAQYNGPEKLYIEVPENYSESDVQIYMDDSFLNQMPGNEELSEEFFGSNAEMIADAYFAYDSMDQALGDEQKADIEWNARYDSSIAKDDKMQVLCITNIRYVIVFDEFKLIGVEEDDVKYKLADIFNVASSNSTNKYPFEIVFDTKNIEYKK